MSQDEWPLNWKHWGWIRGHRQDQTMKQTRCCWDTTGWICQEAQLNANTLFEICFLASCKWLLFKIDKNRFLIVFPSKLNSFQGHSLQMGSMIDVSIYSRVSPKNIPINHELQHSWNTPGDKLWTFATWCLSIGSLRDLPVVRVSSKIETLRVHRTKRLKQGRTWTIDKTLTLKKR